MNELPSGFETFDHTADIGIRFWAPMLPELFAQGGAALFSVIGDKKEDSPTQGGGQVLLPLSQNLSPVLVHLTAENEQELLFNWLRELLFIFDTKHLFLTEFKIRISNNLTPSSPPPTGGGGKGWCLSAEVKGEQINQTTRSFYREVKAVTRHQFSLKQEKGYFIAEAILDL